jgi:hypothetical protein
MISLSQSDSRTEINGKNGLEALEREDQSGMQTDKGTGVGVSGYGTSIPGRNVRHEGVCG